LPSKKFEDFGDDFTDGEEYLVITPYKESTKKAIIGIETPLLINSDDDFTEFLANNIKNTKNVSHC
jgi:hypothetical protein